MTDQGRPLSRRERREAEVRKSAPDQPTTPIPATVAGPATHPDGTPLTRKERRALERGEQGVETWTQEEELIATGQLPAMTPDLLEAQEMVARRRAERDAEVEPEPVAEEPVVEEPVAEAEPEPETEPEPVAEAEPEPEPEAGAPVDEPVEEPAAAEVWEPEAAEQVEQADTRAMAEPVVDEPATEVWEPEAEAEEEPLAEEPLEEPAEQPVAEEPTPSGAIDTIPEEYRHLFPPGSLQARRLEERAARGETATPPAGTAATPEAPEAAAAPEATPAQDDADDPAAEIRRLTAEAMAGITRAQQARRAPAPEPETVEPEAQPEPAADGPEPGVVEEDVETEVLDPAEVYAQAESGSAPADEAIEDDEEEAYAPALAAEAAMQGLPQRGTAVTEAPAPAEVDTATSATPSGGSAIVPAGMRHVAQSSASAPSRWDSHPLAQVQPREVADYAPSEDIPIPDFTKIMHGYASTSSSAGTAPAGEVGDEPTGTDLPGLAGDEYPRRPQPDAPDEGAHHFAWAHLAVIGAVAFLLGVLVWHLTGNA
ncbi:hypothetical protein [Demequina maris]|uniref:hypothetical protein n=1 Tax=Demequina maris TaxID=1638982 RepID=UPI000B13A5CF|nr:hypothetical protein [Demequina maris]